MEKKKPTISNTELIKSLFSDVKQLVIEEFKNFREELLKTNSKTNQDVDYFIHKYQECSLSIIEKMCDNEQYCNNFIKRFKEYKDMNYGLNKQYFIDMNMYDESGTTKTAVFKETLPFFVSISLITIYISNIQNLDNMLDNQKNDMILGCSIFDRSKTLAIIMMNAINTERAFDNDPREVLKSLFKSYLSDKESFKEYDKIITEITKQYNELKKRLPDDISLDDLVNYINNYEPTKLEKEVIKQTNNNILEAELLHQEIATTRPEIINNSENLDKNKINEMVAEAIKEEYIRNENSQNNKTQCDAINNKTKNKKQQSKSKQSQERADIISSLLRKEGFPFGNKGTKNDFIVRIDAKLLDGMDLDNLNKLKQTLGKGEIVPQTSLCRDGIKIDGDFIRIKIGGINFVGPYKKNKEGISIIITECIDNANKSHNDYDKFKKDTISRYSDKYDEYCKTKTEITNDHLLEEIEHLIINNNQPNKNTKNNKKGEKKGK
jgi:hypothetical protein